ncbi:Zinc finger MYND domain-containing protein 10 [Orchesella cincta]|uniref:Zinc finger MYND domain-containing protein 10 n=1 Tax=Orchesella cincta TaxID=48709 RepID=A0A1D2MM09_ORCCI|nr:Zinc finger MYND domain-containing protein 10 [Orchesella cincta]
MSGGGDDRPDVLNHMEIEAYVEALEKSKTMELGSMGWLEKHERVKQLTVQSVIQALSNREETVKESLITHEKLKVLVHDLVLIELWREEILPELAKHTLTQGFSIYPILYHESTCINMLETVLYHPESAETLGDGIIDLTDYCLRLMNQFITFGNDDDEEDEGYQRRQNGSGDHPKLAQEVAEKDVDIIKISRGVLFGNCFKALSTLRYIIENIDSLGASLVSRLTLSSDAPMLLTELILQKPWRRENWQSGKISEFDPTTATWKEIDSSAHFILNRNEIQAWLGLYLLLKNNQVLGNYELYDGRKNQLLKLRAFLNDLSLDQLPILGELQLFLNQLAIQSGGPFAPSKSPLLLEMIAPIRNALEEEFKKKRKKLIKAYTLELIEASRESLLEKAQKLAASYDFNNFEPTLASKGVCANCSKEAEKRCSKCKKEWYCSRECQVEHWKRHKVTCGN